MHQFLLATRNAHKTREFTEILGDAFEVRDLVDTPELPAIEETGSTFEANAILKAVETSQHVQGMVVADDSGLEVDALRGAPGIYSARYAGKGATDTENVAKLLAELRRSPPGQHSARFRCSLALAREGTLLETFHGVVEGTIVEAPRGAKGFGYDPVFQPLGFSQTFGELSAAEKNRISHRARAIQSLARTLLAKP
jgi:XTP/dITP diphosphohydrolase